MRCTLKLRPRVLRKTGGKSSTQQRTVSDSPSVLSAPVFAAFAFAVYVAAASFLETPLCYYLTVSTATLATIA